MKKIMLFLMGLVMSLSLTSCVTTVQASDDLYDGEVDATVVITYGTPIMVDNMIAYYIYNGWYYYPYWIGDRYYLHRYRRALPYEHFRDWYRPIPPGYRPAPRVHRPPHHYNNNAPHHRPHHSNPPRHNNNIGNRPHHGGNTGGRPGGGHSGRGNFGGHR